MKKSYIAAIIVIILAAGAAFATPFIVGKLAEMNPATHVLYAMKKTGEVEKTNATATMTMSVDEAAAEELAIFEFSEDPTAMANYMNSILTNFGIVYDMTYARDQSTFPTYMDYDISMNYKNDPLLNMSMIFEPWTIAFGSEQLFDRMFSYDMKSEADQMDFNQYLAIIYEDDDALYKSAEKNFKQYEDFFMEYLEESLTKLEDGTLETTYDGKVSTHKVDQYLLPVDMKVLFEKMETLIVMFKDDEAMQALIKDRVYKVVDTFVESGDYLKLSMTESEAKSMQSSLKASYDEEFDKMLDEMINSYSTIGTEYDDMGISMNYDLLIKIDSNNLIRAMEIDMLSAFIRMKQIYTYNAFDGDVVISSIETQNTEDIKSLMEDDQKTSEIAQTLITNAYSNILGSKAFNSLMTDLEVNAQQLPEAERTEILNGIGEMMQMMPFLMQGL
ncbi:MAG: hypothetical protein K8R73_07790 [Clostridiales bacterium]|nr:hypothetical protein [Clostridiales bacterium]